MSQSEVGKGARVSAIDSILSVTPTDDAGAITADLYDWQAAMAAADGLATFGQHLDGSLGALDTADVRIICEYHEDWIVQLGASAELVSAKHREQSSGPWQSIAVLVTDGGLGHLFARWILVERKASVRLVSCVATAKGEASDLVDCPALLRRQRSGETITQAEAEKLQRCVEHLARSLMMYRKNLPTPWQAPEGARAKNLTIPTALTEAVQEFVAGLTIEKPRPHRDLTDHAAPSLYAQPLMAKLGQSDALAAAVWHAVLQLFRVRMRARGPSSNGGLPPVGAGNIGASPPATNSELETRIVTLQDVSIAINTALASPAAYIPIPSPTRLSKLSMKMANGGCSDTSIERAERLRIDYSRYRRERRNSVPGSEAELPPLKRALHRIADEETKQSRTPMGLWGDELWTSLSRRLEYAPAELTKIGLDGELGLGGICDLASRCQVWFGPRFDVDAAIANAKAVRSGLT